MDLFVDPSVSVTSIPTNDLMTEQPVTHEHEHDITSVQEVVVTAESQVTTVVHDQKTDQNLSQQFISTSTPTLPNGISVRYVQNSQVLARLVNNRRIEVVRTNISPGPSTRRNISLTLGVDSQLQDSSRRQPLTYLVSNPFVDTRTKCIEMEKKFRQMDGTDPKSTNQNEPKPNQRSLSSPQVLTKEFHPNREFLEICKLPPLEDIIQEFKCIVCGTFPRPPVRACQKNGHLCCDNCFSSFVSCPRLGSFSNNTCSSKFYKFEFRPYKYLFLNCTVYCPYHKSGCSETILGLNLDSHKEVCPFRPYVECQFSICHIGKTSYVDYVDHVLTVHQVPVHNRAVTRIYASYDQANRSIPLTDKSYRYVLGILDVFELQFAVVVEATIEDLKLWVACMNNPEVVGKRSFDTRISVRTYSSNYTMSWEGEIHARDKSVTHIISEQECFVVLKSILKKKYVYVSATEEEVWNCDVRIIDIPAPEDQEIAGEPESEESSEDETEFLETTSENVQQVSGNGVSSEVVNIENEAIIGDKSDHVLPLDNLPDTKHQSSQELDITNNRLGSISEASELPLQELLNGTETPVSKKDPEEQPDKEILDVKPEDTDDEPSDEDYDTEIEA